MGGDDERCTREQTIEHIVSFLRNDKILDDGVQEDQGNILSDLCAVINQDPSFPGGACAASVTPPLSDKPFVKIIEEPAHVFRFCYKSECDLRSAGSIRGKSSTRQNKTYPRIKIGNYVGKAIVLISLVSKDPPYKAHPHNLVGRDCSQGVSTIELTITEEECEYAATNLGIEYTKRHDVTESLAARQKLRIDPFGNKFDHKDDPGSVSLKAVRLCFQVFIPDDEGRLRRPLTPVVSDIIKHKKVKSDKLLIKSPNVCSGTALGGTKVYLLCENVGRNGVKVIFYQEENGVKVWKEMATETLAHKHAAIVFKTPAYRHSNITKPVQVYYQLKRLSDNSRSTPMPFEYVPEFAETSNKQRNEINGLLQHYTLENWSPLHHSTSGSPLHGNASQFEQIWGLDNMLGSLGVPGPSYLEQNMSNSNPAVMVEVIWASQPDGQVSPIFKQTPVANQNLQMSQNMHSMSPNMQPLSKEKKHISPELQLLTLYLGPIAPSMQQTYNVTENMWPNMAVQSPQEETTSSEIEMISPMDQMSPNISQNIQSLSPNVEQTYITTDSMWPNMVVMSPFGEINSSNMQVMSPLDQISQNMPQNMQPLSPNIQQTYGTTEYMSLNMEVMSPHVETMSPDVKVLTQKGSSSQDTYMGFTSPDSEQQKST